MAPFLLLIGLQAAPPSTVAQAPSEAEVTVVARRGKCSVSIADRMISDRAFRARAKEWAAGTPVRIVSPDTTDYRCLTKIMGRLREYGVTRAQIVQPGQP